MPSGEPVLSTTTKSPMQMPPTRWSVDELIPFGKYILLNKISAGATAAVYRAKVRGEAGFERLVTIKRILPQMAGDPEFVETFVGEAKVCARLTHSNICPIYELGKVGESLYMASEWVAGKDLRAILQRLQTTGRAMPPLAAAWIASRLCDALDYAHGLKDANGERLGILHQDLSPANIVVSYDGAVKLLDFGIARATGRAQQTNVDALKQKLGYMSPELVLGTQIDRRSDLFGVGVCLYEMVTGKRLFAGSDDIATLKLLRDATVPAPSALRADTPAELEQIILRALARDPEARWPSAGEMAHALTAFVAAEDPTYGTRNLTELMQELFAQDRQTEQAKLHELLTASQDAKLMEQRRRFFASPLGAAAVAKAEATRRLTSTRPPPSGALAAPAPAKPPTKAPAPHAEASVTDSHISERRSRVPTPVDTPNAPNAQPAQTAGQASDSQPAANQAANQAANEEDDALTTFRPPIVTPRPGTVARDGLTTAATYDELIRRSKEEDDAELTTYRAEPSHGTNLAGKGSAKHQPAAVPPGLSLLDMQNEQTVFELNPDEYSEPLVDPEPEPEPESESESEVAVDFETEATHFLSSGTSAAARALLESPGAPANSKGDYEEEATHIFFSSDEGLGLPDVPDDELTTVSPPTPLRVPPPAGAGTAAKAPPSAARQNTGAFAPFSNSQLPPTSRASTGPTGSAQSMPPRTASRLPTVVLSSLPPATQRGPLLWVIAAALVVVMTGLALKTPLGITLGLRKPPTGIIEIRTDPSVPAAVRLDGIYRGRTPLRLEGVPAGPCIITLQADGYATVTRSLTLEGGSVVKADIALSTPAASGSPLAGP